ncbi:DNA damage-regulated autophagy modulator protein 2-like [Sitophilus oryzae]|uniref:DNA damage-regulated autophagy modulator protein 2-like n=1 Tax=Sitophilus oryzae TaxID=7048 RepID=A0A6J2YMS7_SITOR|nr:DNA damage-regulated autophagy modulator protein 2-like [Sitophilus oryzae]
MTHRAVKHITVNGDRVKVATHGENRILKPNVSSGSRKRKSGIRSGGRSWHPEWYTMSTASQHVKPVFPYISDTGTWPPESCIFSLMLFIFSIIMGVLYCVRFKQVQIFCENLPEKTKTSILKLNKTSLWFGFASCFGLVLVASFQETNLMWVHMLGAGNVYGGGCIYQWLQVVIVKFTTVYFWRTLPENICSRIIANLKIYCAPLP